tara:strand:+ start:3731 stop:4150 length:420 start_codon:yes stop_codon:yes gene_type:complete
MKGHLYAAGLALALSITPHAAAAEEPALSPYEVMELSQRVAHTYKRGEYGELYKTEELCWEAAKGVKDTAVCLTLAMAGGYAAYNSRFISAKYSDSSALGNRVRSRVSKSLGLNDEQTTQFLDDQLTPHLENILVGVNM